MSVPGEREPLLRRARGRLIAGVCTGISRHLGVNLTLVRLLFIVVGSNGIGIVAYLVLWAMVPDESDDGSGRTKLRRPRQVLRALMRDRPGDVPHRRHKILLYIVAGTALGAVFGAIGFGIGGGLPLSLALLGALLIWWRAPEGQRRQWSRDARIAGTFLGRRAPLLIMLGGVGLVVVGVTSFLAAHDALAQARAGALAIGATLVGVLLVTGPFLYRLIGQVTEERRRRIRADERAAVATHVHDSVLQTLALIQAKAASPEDVRRLARRQERELRDWLYAPDGSNGAGEELSFAVALRSGAAEIEDETGVVIEVVVVGDAPMDEALAATVAATREAMLNAAKSSGAPEVSVFAEVEPTAIEVFVRDRGRGFDPDAVPADRRGIRDSIVGRMARHGGVGVVRSGPAGTEVELTLSRVPS